MGEETGGQANNAVSAKIKESTKKINTVVQMVIVPDHGGGRRK